MPYFQLDTPFPVSREQCRRLAKRFGEIYVATLGGNVNRLSVAVRELGDGKLWRCGDGEPRPAAILMCDIRRGRPPEVRAAFARQMVEACIEICGLSKETLNLEFTQHAGDEMYHTMYGGLSDEFVPGEADRLGRPD